MRILFIGCVLSSEVLLTKLINMKCEIVGVITKKKSSFNNDFRDLGKICKINNIDFIYTDNINDGCSKEYINMKAPDVIYCFGWSQIIGEEVLMIPEKGVIGFHPTQLPNNRGRHPIIWALVLGLEKTASTFFFMDQGADTGDILSQVEIKIAYSDTAITLYEKILESACVQIERFTIELKAGNPLRIKQNLQMGNAWRKRRMDDGRIDWRMTSYGIYNLVRGLSKPYVGAHMTYNDKSYHVWKVEEKISLELDNIEPGKVVEVVSETDFCIKAFDNLVHVIESDPIFLRVGDYIL